MIHHKDFPFEPREDEAEIVYVAPHSKGRSSLLTRVLVTLVFLGMVGLSVKALYDFGRGSSFDGSVKIVEANPEPYKVTPEDPGGMDIPHDDKEIYDHIKMPIEQPIDIFKDREDPIANLISDNDTLVQQKKTPIPVVVRPKKPEPKIVTILPSGLTSTAPSNQANIHTKPNIELTGAKKIEVDKVLSRKRDPEIWMQLGTYKSEQEATKAWQDVREKNSDIIGSTGIKVTRSDFGPQGTVYRLQAGPIGTEVEAKQLCTKLNERKLSCFHTITNPTTP